jgi:RNA polymerase sigma factor (sigma-70 family)
LKDQSEIVKRIYKNRRSVTSWVLKNSGSKQDADDVLQESIIVFLRLYSEGKVSDVSEPMPLVMFIAKRFWLGKLRSKKSHIELTENDHMLDIDLDVEEQLEKEKRIKLAQDALTDIGEQCKKLLKLFYFNAKRLDEIASILGFRNEHVARSMKYKCLEKLRTIVNKTTQA